MSIFPPDVTQQAQRIIEDFSKRGLMVSTAESCTGGLIAGALTEIPGSSAVVDRGFVTYTNEAKMQMIGVSEMTLKAYGAVSKDTALEMAQGALSHSRASISVAVTGVAGPGGGSDEKPVGLVHLAAQNNSGFVLHRERRYGDLGRTEIRLATVRTALQMLIEVAAQT